MWLGSAARQTAGMYVRKASQLIAKLRKAWRLWYPSMQMCGCRHLQQVMTLVRLDMAFSVVKGFTFPVSVGKAIWL